WLASGAAVMLAATALADIRTTPHSLRRGGSQLDPKEVCVFCHTPTISASDDGLQRVVPLWQQRSLPADHSFALYDDIGRLQYGDKPAVGSQSVACLSCHDSTQALSVTKSDYDHPYGVPYRGFLRHRPLADGTVRRGDDEAPAMLARYLKSMEDFRAPSNAKVDNRTVWWVSTTGNLAVRSRSDLPLYVREDLATGGEVPFIECGSCHDPHSNNRLFLRVTDQGSKLCLACHDK
ncbi:MAG TPA: cytochrome c3 family protein, partial [Azospira sp.]|nr:cytochrome c3 family protein [Azospira sp.]